MNNNNISKLTDILTQELGADRIILDQQTREYCSEDLSFRPHGVAAAIVQPKTVEELAKAVKLSTSAGYDIVPRGGGMSYTSGYTPQDDNSVLVDMTAMDKILEINADDMYVTVECGCTWKTLHEALQPLGVRTPYSGPLSGAFATVGGALSQNSLFHGSGVHGTAAETVVGLHVVLADGSVLVTGSGAKNNARPSFRHFGPDLTGLFTSDTGAFGVKAIATLRLVTAPKATGYVSFKFDTLESMLNAQTKISRMSIASECYGFDPYYNNGFKDKGVTFEEGISLVGKIARKGGIKGIKNAAKLALAGKRLLNNVPYSLHMTIDAHTETAASEHVDIAAEICKEAGGTEMASSIPVAFRAEPFGNVRTIILGSKGEIWLPMNGLFPLSMANVAAEATEKFLKEKAPILEKYGIKTSYLTVFAGKDFGIEPSFYWADRPGDFRLSKIEPEFAKKWKDIPEDKETRQIALQLRDELTALYDSLGASHFQYGKYYAFLSEMNNPTTPKIFREIKNVLDPECRINPGSLEFDK